MTTLTTRLRAAAALSTLGLIALTGCSTAETTDPRAGQLEAEESLQAAEAEAASNVFDFSVPSWAYPGPEVTVALPQALLEIVDPSVGVIPIESLTITARELDSAKFCALDAAIGYTGGDVDAAVELFSQPKFTLEWLEGIVMEEARASADNGASEADVEQIAEGLRSAYSADYDYLEQPAFAFLSENLWNVRPIADLDLADPKPGKYISDDYTQVTAVGECALSPSEEEAGAWFSFKAFAEDGKRAEIADFYVNVMKDGSLGVQGAEVDGYVTDANGEWLQQ